MKKTTEQRQIDKLCKTIADLTDNNDHTGAKTVLAKFFNFDNFVKVFTAVETIHDVEGSMPGEISAYRRRKGIELIDAVQEIAPTYVEQIKNAF